MDSTLPNGATCTTAEVHEGCSRGRGSGTVGGLQTRNSAFWPQPQPPPPPQPPRSSAPPSPSSRDVASYAPARALGRPVALSLKRLSHVDGDGCGEPQLPSDRGRAAAPPLSAVGSLTLRWSYGGEGRCGGRPSHRAGEKEESAGERNKGLDSKSQIPQLQRERERDRRGEGGATARRNRHEGGREGGRDEAAVLSSPALRCQKSEKGRITLCRYSTEQESERAAKNALAVKQVRG